MPGAQRATRVGAEAGTAQGYDHRRRDSGPVLSVRTAQGRVLAGYREPKPGASRNPAICNQAGARLESILDVRRESRRFIRNTSRIIGGEARIISGAIRVSSEGAGSGPPN